MDGEDLGLGPAIQTLVMPGGAALRPMPLVPSSPRGLPQLERLRTMSAGDLLGNESIRSASDADCVLSGLFLYFCALDESHTISQGIRTPSGSYWHGIMHRQEGDWNNAKYWFRRTGSHPVFDELERGTGARWDPFQFVDRCSRAASGSGDAREPAALQLIEWRLLMRHCYRKAIGR